MDRGVRAQLLIYSPSSASDLHFAEEIGAKYPWKRNNLVAKKREEANSSAFMISTVQ